MYVRSALPRAPKDTGEGLVLEEVSALDRAVDSLEVLEQHPPRPDGQMAHFGISHLPLRKADGRARGGERGVRVALPQPVEHGCVGELNRVARPRRSASPPVQDDEGYEREAASS